MFLPHLRPDFNVRPVYEVTQKGEPFKGTEVSRKSVAALVRHRHVPRPVVTREPGCEQARHRR
jgi:hypothetical protein